MRNHCMVDLETMDTSSTAAIVSIGAAFFDPTEDWEPEFPDNIDLFYRNVDLQSSIDVGGTVNGGTVLWWMAQGKEAVDALTDPKPVKIRSALNDFRSWFFDSRRKIAETNDVDIKEVEIYIWAKGSCFDHPILSTAFKHCNMREPWMFWNARDVRTTFAHAFGDNGKPEYEGFGDKHNALHDTLGQIIQMQEAYRKLGE